MQRFGVLLVGGAKAGAVVVAGGHLTTIGCLAAIAGVLLFVGVVLPAVWSSEPDRRRDARAVLRLILQTVRRPR